MKFATIIGLVLFTATADPAELQDVVPVLPGWRADSHGQSTRAWLELQRSGTEAPAVRPLPGPVASRIYRRYLDSFDHPIPEFFERERMAGQTN